MSKNQDSEKPSRGPIATVNTDAALKGCLTEGYPDLAKIVRIFTSSTFTDTSVERNNLMEKVYPQLKTYCQERGYEFQVVDMRWGVRDESTVDHRTSELCMRELRECQRLSTGPNFITFLGQKYGYRPFPPIIPATDFEKILSAVANKSDSELLQKWFKKDENRIPDTDYLLQPILDYLPHYSDVDNAEKRKKDQDAWWNDFERMQLILRGAASKVFPDGVKKHMFYMSVTEDEITHGILNATNPDKHCHWFRRTITDMLDKTSAKKAFRFMDMSKGKVDEEAKKLLSRLKNDLIPAKLPGKFITDYKVKWNDEGINPALKEHQAYIDQFLKDFYATLCSMISQGIVEKQGVHQLDESLLEVVRHVTFAKEKSESFCGRGTLLENIEKKIKAGNKKPVVITGTTGSGKTALISKVAELLPIWFSDKEVVTIVRFVGTTMASSSIRPLLISLCQQVGKLFMQELPEGISKLSLKMLVETFAKLLNSVDQNREVFILLDSLDQLDESGNGRKMDWLPASLKLKNVHMILSTLPDDEFEVLPALKLRIKDESCYVNVKTLETSDIDVIVKESLNGMGRSLTSVQMKVVKDAISACAYPLYLKLALDEAARWKSYSTPDVTRLEPTVPKVIHALLDRLERYHGLLLISHALGYITASKAGLSEAELDDILSCDDEVLNDVYQYSVPPVRRLPPLLWVRVRNELSEYLTDHGSDGVQVINWYHRQFIDVATERYLADKAQRKFYNAALADYFIGKWSGKVKKPYKDKKGVPCEAERFVSAQPLVYKEADNPDDVICNYRKMSELPYNLIMSGNIDLLKKQVFCNMLFLYQKIRASGIDSVLDDFDFAESQGLMDADVEAVLNALKMSINGILTDFKQLPVQLAARLNTQKSNNSKYLTDLALQGENMPFPCLLTRQGFLSLGDGKMVRIAGHEIQIMALALSEKCNKVVTAAMDNIVCISDLDSGRSIKTWNVSELLDTYHPDHVLLCKNDELLVCGWRHQICFIDVLSGEVLKEKTIRNIKQEEGFHQVPMQYYPQKSLLLYLTDQKLMVWSLKDFTKVAEIDAGIFPAGNMMAKEYFQIVGSTVLILRPGAADVRTGDLEALVKNEPFKKFAINDNPEKWTYHAVMTPSKKVVCFIYSNDPPVVGKMTYKQPEIKVFTNGKLTKTFPCFQMTYAVGKEILLDCMDDKHVLFNNFEATAGGSAIYCINIETGKFHLSLQETGLISNADYYGGGRLAVVNATSPTVVDIKRIEIGADRGEVEAGCSDDNLVTSAFADEVECTNVLPSSVRFVASSNRNFGLHIWDLARMKEVRLLEVRNIGCYTTLMEFPTSSTAVSFTGQKQLVSFDLKTLEMFGPHDPPMSGKPQTNSIRVVNSKTAIGPAPKDQTCVKIYDVKTGKAISSLKMKAKEKVQSLELSGNSQFAFFFMGSYVAVWDLKKMSRLPDIKFQGLKEMDINSKGSVAISYDGQHFVAVDKYTNNKQNFIVWDVQTGKATPVKSPFASNINSCSVAISRKLQSVIVGYNTDLVAIFGLKSLQCDESFKLLSTISFVNSITLNEDGTLMATKGGQETTIVLIDLEKRTRIATVTADASLLGEGRFSKDSNFFILGGSKFKGPVQLFIHRPENKVNFEQALAALKKKEDIFGEYKKRTLEPLVKPEDAEKNPKAAK
ncbi:NACHT domain- and WD repeat-containing protein 1-like isoform X2 [Lineus longissimus]